jgi:hypothetical protein
MVNASSLENNDFKAKFKTLNEIVSELRDKRKVTKALEWSRQHIGGA